ncbi:hypothetical protein MXMO3_01801 [Maritalea myrionectae]|uniref:Uncharacterized protein n=1 Tax=Maritalea myrionectae TaxID=454601 RepID=A0A2R4MEL2_9HYPH|nr:hypothetical protein [Maritalea myrionectae]AVX04326.1 hypothetical protein MXMO3_01801 [Maritalea myrionectae]
MTCIVGLVENGDIYIGGDSAGVSGSLMTVRKDPKVCRVGDFIIGFTSSFRMGQLLAHSFEPPKHYDETDLYDYMVTSFVDAVRDCLKRGGFARVDSSAEEGGTFLVGYKGRLFEIESDYQVGEALSGYAACGCGREVALGALFATNGQKPKDRIKTALEAAASLNAYVRAPFNVLSV